MKISYQWLKELLPDLKATPRELADRLTLAGLEVESLTEQGQGLEGIIVAQVLEKNKHPNADRLNVCLVDDGTSRLQIVCGAANVEAGGKYPLAQIGATLPNGLVIKKSAIRSVESNGMLCSAKELGLAEESQGLLTLKPDAKVGQGFKDHMGFDDVIFEIGVTPNRGDCLSHLGLAYEVAALYGLDFSPPKWSFEGGKGQAPVQIEIKTPFCTRYVGALIKNVKIGPSQPLISKRLESLGIRSINNVVDATNYIMLLTGHPLHAFDASAIRDHAIIVSEAEKGMSFKTLDGKEKDLHKGDLLICDRSSPLALAGVMGGQNSEVTDQTSELLLEAASFDPDAIRRTSRRLGLVSESSYRFERGVSDATVLEAMKALIGLILQSTGGELAGAIADLHPAPSLPRTVFLSQKRLHAYAGTDLNPAEVETTLKSLHLEPQPEEGGWNTLVPSWRFDLTIEEDLIEEIIRIRGFNAIESVLPRRPMALAFEPRSRRISRGFKAHLIAQGYSETINYSFISKAELEALGLESSKAIALANPLSEELAVMRPSLLPSLLKTASKNKPHQPDGARYFELRPVFTPEGEKLMLGVLSLGNRFQANWRQIAQEASYFEMKGLLEDLMAPGYLRLRYASGAPEFMHPGQSCVAQAGSDRLASLGQIHPRIAAALGFNQPLAYMELDLGVATKYWKDGAPVRSQFSAQPTIIRDLALLVPCDMTYATLEGAILKKGIKQLKYINLFDVYEGEKVKEGSKSLALSLTYGDDEKTLTDQEINDIHFKLVKELEKDLGVVLR